VAADWRLAACMRCGMGDVCSDSYSYLLHTTYQWLIFQDTFKALIRFLRTRMSPAMSQNKSSFRLVRCGGSGRKKNESKVTLESITSYNQKLGTQRESNKLALSKLLRHERL